MVWHGAAWCDMGGKKICRGSLSRQSVAQNRVCVCVCVHVCVIACSECVLCAQYVLCVCCVSVCVCVRVLGVCAHVCDCMF